MKVYFDMCCLQRPLDDKSQVRVLVESQAVLGIMSLCELGKVDLVASEAHIFEIESNPNQLRRDFAVQTLEKATQFVTVDDQIKKLAQSFVDLGIKPLDALHLACAISAPTNFFCTCDDRFLKKAKQIDTHSTKVVSPLELVLEVQS